MDVWSSFTRLWDAKSGCVGRLICRPTSVVPGLIAVVALLAGSASANTYVIRPDGSGDYATIQPAIAAVADGDTLLLADGRFTGAGNRDLDYLGKAITIQSQSGDPESCVIDCEGTWEQPHRGFSFHSGEGATSVLRGVTITNGRSLPVCPGCAGGGIECLEQSSPRIENCSFRQNAAASSGGGLVCIDSSPALVHCLFVDNATETGGGGAGMACFDGHPTFLQCSFVANLSAMGGGFACGDHSRPEFRDCLFQDNVATSDGGGAIFQESTALLDACTFRGNTSNFGGALSCVACDTVRVSGCTFSGNAAAYHGGGLHSWDSFTRLEKTIVAFNTDGRGVYCDGTGSIEASCCDIVGNVDGDWVGCVAGQDGIDGNFAADPRFCDPLTGDLRLQEGSPCAPGANPDCGLIGAWPVGCGDPQDAGPGPISPPVAISATPNPFVAGTRISCSLPPGTPGDVSVEILDVAGRRIRQLPVVTGSGAVPRTWWDGADDAGRALPGGIYLIRIAGAGRAPAERVIKLK